LSLYFLQTAIEVPLFVELAACCFAEKMLWQLLEDRKLQPSTLTLPFVTGSMDCQKGKYMRAL